MGSSDRATGFDLGEAAGCWEPLRRNNIAVDFFSMNGGPVPRAGSRGTSAEAAFLADPGVVRSLAETIPAAAVDVAGYSGVLFVGGHGTMWDFPHEPLLGHIISGIHQAGGVVAAICHGPAAFLGAQRPDGSPLVAGRRLTCFSSAEEKSRGLSDVVPFDLQEALVDLGARHTAAADRVAHVVSDDGLLTGQNPASANLLAEALLTALQG